MKLIKKFLSILLTIIVLFAEFSCMAVYAAEYDQQKPPEKLRAAENGIGNNQYEGYYVDLEWEYPSGFIVSGSSGTFLNFYIQEVPKPYLSSSSRRELKEGGIKVETSPSLSPTSYRLKTLKSGTIYYIDATAYYRYYDGNNTRQSNESQASNRIKVMTDIDINVYSVGPNQIKIEWDDVWSSNGRISYKLYVSDSDKFSNVPSRYIDPSSIGPGKPVQVNQTTGKLEYTHTVSESGKVYYVKIEPDISDPELLYYPQASKTVAVSSFILARGTKISSSSEGTRWRLDWSPVYAGLTDIVDIKYEIYRGDTRTNELPGRIQTVSGNSISIILKPGEEEYVYFIIRAIVTRKDNGQPYYPGIKIESDKVMMKDYDVGAHPPVPELVQELGDVKSEITHNSAILLWKIPKKVTGEIDYDTSYDVWLVTDPDMLHETDKLGDPVSWNLKDGTESFTSGRLTYNFDIVKNSAGSVLGIKCTVTGLDQNSVYYFKLQAWKSYLEYKDDVPAYVSYSSLPAIRVIVTPSDGDASQPVTPPKPPFRLKKETGGNFVVTDTTAVVQIKKKWYEKYNPDINKWEYLKTEKDDPSDLDPTYPISPEELPLHKNEYRMLEYGDDILIDLYYIEYEEGMDYQNLYDESKYKPVKVSGFPVIANDDSENPELNYPDKKEKRNVDILISGLKPNTTYVVWVKAVKMKDGSYLAESEPSDPVIVTTNPSEEHPVEIPTVPTLFVNQVGDTYVDLIWDFNEEYNYYIDYGTSENMNPAAEGTPVDLMGRNYYRIDGLDKDTIYYFRIRAEYVSPSGESRKSDWSDPCSARTLADIPPNTPQGFGIKTSKDAITKNSITYEWVQEEGLEYILELADNPDFKNSKEYNAGAVSEYKADNLRSNHRYYARLYAYDPSKKLRSSPTGTVSVMTKRSTDDYDSDEDVEDVISGDFIEKSPVIVDNTWVIRIIGVNADRLIEYMQNDKVLDYKIGLEVLPANVKRIKLIISARVFSGLTKLKENLIIAIPQRLFTIRPGMLDVQKASEMLSGNTDFNFEIDIELESLEYNSKMGNIKPLTKATGFRVFALDGENPIAISTFKKPLKVTYLYTDRSWYTDGLTSGFVYNEESSQWEKADATAYYDRDNGQGYMSFGTLIPGDMLAAEPDDNFYDDIGKHWAARSIKNVASAHVLKSISGRNFDPDSFITIGDAIKFMLDMMDYDYGNDYMTLAVRSGIASSTDLGNVNSLCTREKLIVMTVRLYELKSGEKASVSDNRVTAYNDINEVSAGALQKVKFAIENGIIISRFSDTLGPKDPVTRAEAIVLLEKLLVFIGEISYK